MSYETKDRLKRLICDKKKLLNLAKRFSGKDHESIMKKVAQIDSSIEKCKVTIQNEYSVYLRDTRSRLEDLDRIAQEQEEIKNKKRKRQKKLALARKKAKQAENQKKYGWIFEALAWLLIGGFFIGGGVFILYNVAMFFSGKPMWIPFYE